MKFIIYVLSKLLSECDIPIYYIKNKFTPVPKIMLKLTCHLIDNSLCILFNFKSIAVTTLSHEITYFDKLLQDLDIICVLSLDPVLEQVLP